MKVLLGNREYLMEHINKIIHGNCLEKLKELPENSIDSICTDPPYELGFMGKSWDSTGIANNVELWKECLRVLKPGGHLLAFSGTRTYHRMASAIEDAGFEVRDMIEWVYGCLSEDTEILTSNGWKMLYSVFEGDYVFACDYKNDMKLQLESVKQKFIYDYDEDAYHIKDTGYYNSELMETDHIVSKNHNVLVSESWAMDCYSNGEYPQKVFAEILYENVQKRKELGYKSEFHIPGLNGYIPCTIEKIPYKGKVWCVEVESGAFVARRKGQVFITGNSGFPKSLNIGKAVDKINGETGRLLKFVEWYRTTGMKQKETNEIIGKTDVGSHYLRLDQPAIPTRELWAILRPHIKTEIPQWVDELVERIQREREVISSEKVSNRPGFSGERYGNVGDVDYDYTKGTSEWEGWGTALKPAHEPICMARKPLEEKTIAENCLKYGTGGINIDESRVGTTQKETEAREKWNKYANKEYENGGTSYGELMTKTGENSLLGRFPANLIHDNSEEVRECFPESKSAGKYKEDKLNTFKPDKAMFALGYQTNAYAGDSGNASRFFKSIIYQAKSSKSDRTSNGTVINTHPTVKSVTLMTYLIKMVTPKGGIVLDPFAGSGSTLIAAKQNGFNYVGIEMTEEYIPIINARLGL